MSSGKYVKIDGVIKQVVGEYAKINGVIREGTINAINVGGDIKQIAIAAKMIFACEHESGRFYAVNSEHGIITGWPVSGDPIRQPADVACDADNNSYWGCAADYYYVYKRAADGTSIWTYTGHTSPIHAICVDVDGYVYSGDSGGTVKRIKPDGTLDWSETPRTENVYALAIDYSAGRLYAAYGGVSSDRVIESFNMFGNSFEIYPSPTTGSPFYSVAIDEEDTPSLYIGDAAGHLIKMGLDGYTYWDKVVGGEVHAVRVGHDGYGYFVNGTSGGVGKFILATGQSVWYHAVGGEARDVTVDKAGHVYSSHGISGSANAVIRKWNAAGVEQWTWQPYIDSEWMGVAVSPGIKAAGF